MKYLGIDHGNKRIGIAISDELGMFARPLFVHEHVSRRTDAEFIAFFAGDNCCDAIVVGLPLDGDGSIGPRARSVLHFVEQLEIFSLVPVIVWDESNSTRRAVQLSIQRGEKRKDRKEAMDDQAAAIILQDYLDSTNPAKSDEVI